MLAPSGWGIDALAFLVLTRSHAGSLEPHAFAARHRSAGGLDLHPIAVEVISDDDSRVGQLLSPIPAELKAIVPEETLEDAHAQLSRHPRDGVELYGYQRLEEGLIQALATSPVLDTYRVGRAFLEAPSLPSASERELRVLFCRNGQLEVTFRFGGVSVPCSLESPRLLGGLTARNDGLADARALARKHVAFVGLGSVGAPIALELVRAGLGQFTLLDIDRFSVQNVARHIGDLRDLGRWKDRLLEEKLLARNPMAQVCCPRLDVRDLAQQELLEQALGDADLLVVTTDDPTANLAANRLAMSLQIPALFVGVFEGGIGGEIFVYRPPAPGCYNCVAGFRARLPSLPRASRAHDYLALRPGADLPPINALGIDIGHTVSIASSAALGLLGVDQRLEGLLTPELPLLLVANGRPGWIFNGAFEVIPATLEAPGCPICAAGVSPQEDAPELCEHPISPDDSPLLAEEDMSDEEESTSADDTLETAIELAPSEANEKIDEDAQSEDAQSEDAQSEDAQHDDASVDGLDDVLDPNWPGNGAAGDMAEGAGQDKGAEADDDDGWDDGDGWDDALEEVTDSWFEEVSDDSPPQRQGGEAVPAHAAETLPFAMPKEEAPAPPVSPRKSRFDDPLGRWMLEQRAATSQGTSSQAVLRETGQATASEPEMLERGIPPQPGATSEPATERPRAPLFRNSGRVS